MILQIKAEQNNVDYSAVPTFQGGRLSQKTLNLNWFPESQVTNNDIGKECLGFPSASERQARCDGSRLVRDTSVLCRRVLSAVQVTSRPFRGSFCCCYCFTVKFSSSEIWTVLGKRNQNTGCTLKLCEWACVCVRARVHALMERCPVLD